MTICSIVQKAETNPVSSGGTMATKYWMISNRSVDGNRLSGDPGKTHYWTSDSEQLDRLENWTRVSPVRFRTELAAAADQFPPILELAEHEEQKHVTLFIHGYNNSWEDAVRRYQSICSKMFTGNDGL